MKKKIVALLYVLILFSTFSIGFATWILSGDFTFEPDYIYDTEFNFYNQNITYNGQTQNIVIPDSLTDIINATNYEDAKYYEKGTNNLDELHKNSGTYDVVFTSINKNYEDIKVNFTIEPIVAQFDYGILVGSKAGKRFESATNEIKYQNVVGTLIYPDIKVKNALGNDDVKVDIGTNNLELKISSVEQKVNYNVGKLVGNDAFNYKLPNTTTFTITLNSKKIKLHLDLQEYSLNCPTITNERKWGKLTEGGIQYKLDTFINDHIIDENGDKVSLAVTVDYMHDGTNYYLGDTGKKPSNLNLKKPTYNNVIGSTYEVKLKVKSPDKYELEPGLDSFIFKYRTVVSGASYYTIEEALLSTGNIKLVGDASSSNSFVPTTFTNLNYYKGQDKKVIKVFNLEGGRELLIPFEDSNSYVNSYTSMDDATGSGKYDYVYSALIVPENITLNIKSKSKLVVGGYVRHTGLVRNHGVLMNNGTINIDGAFFNSYGYTKGEYDNNKQLFKGIINVINGSAASDVMRMYDWPGGTNATHMYNPVGGLFGGDRVFPVYSYSFHNISSKISIDNTSALSAHYRISGGGKQVYGDVNLIGRNNNGVGLFTLIGNGNIVKYSYDNSVVNNVAQNNYNMNNSITTSNQNVYQKDVIEISGNFEDNPMALTVAGFTFETSASLALPIGFMKIKLLEGTSGSLSKSSFKFMPGSEIEIDPKATLTIGSGIDIIGYDENYNTTDDYLYDGGTAGTGQFTYSKIHTNWFNQTDKSNIGARITNNGTLIANGGCGMKVLNTTLGAQTIFTAKSSGTVVDLSVLNSGAAGNAKFKNVSKSSNGKIINLDGTNNRFNTQKVYLSNSNNEWVEQAGTLNEVKVTFVNNNGTPDIVQSFYYPSNGNGYTITGSESIPQKKYNKFEGWYTDSGLTVSAKDLVVKTNKTLYAKYTPRVYSVICDYGYNNEPLFADDGVIGPQEIMTFQFDGTNFIFSETNKCTSIDLPADNLTSYKDKRQASGWFIGNHQLHYNINLSSITASQMASYLSYDDSMNLYIFKQFYDFSVNIDYGNNIVDVYYLANNQKLKDVNFEINNSINVKNNDYKTPTYIDEFKYNNDYIHFNDMGEFVFNKDPNLIEDKYLSLGLAKQKYKITSNIVNNNYNVKLEIWDEVKYYMPGQMLGKTNYDTIVNKQIDINRNPDISGYSDGSINVNNVLVEFNENICFDGDSVISFNYYDKFKLNLQNTAKYYSADVTLNINGGVYNKNVGNKSSINVWVVKNQKLIIDCTGKTGSGKWTINYSGASSEAKHETSLSIEVINNNTTVTFS